MIKKEEELRFLKRLERYFKNIPAKDIKQNKPSISRKENCGCFGAHIAKCFDLRCYLKIEEYSNYYWVLEGELMFVNNIRPETNKLFIKYGGGAGVIDNCAQSIFLSYDWRKHPYEVIAKVLNELEKETK